MSDGERRIREEILSQKRKKRKEREKEGNQHGLWGWKPDAVVLLCLGSDRGDLPADDERAFGAGEHWKSAGDDDAAVCRGDHPGDALAEPGCFSSAAAG